MKDIIISDKKGLQEKIKRISEQGKEKLHVIADFDRTLTKAFVNGEKISSLISILRKDKYLTPDYPQKAQLLHDKYYPIEININIPVKEKINVMEEWWISHFDLLIKSKLNKTDIEKIIKSERINFREGVLEFLDFLHSHNIPLIIFSSSGLGKESIQMYLENKKKFYKNIHIVSNSFKWDKDGYAIEVKKPIITSMNKSEISVKGLPIYNELLKRKNVILLGDSLGDVGMIEGFPYENSIKIGFLNENIKESLEDYKKNYDVVVLNDGSFDYVDELLERLIKNY